MTVQGHDLILGTPGFGQDRADGLTDTMRRGLVSVTFWSLSSFMRPFAQMTRGFCRLGMNAAAVDYRSLCGCLFQCKTFFRVL